MKSALYRCYYVKVKTVWEYEEIIVDNPEKLLILFKF